MMTMEQAIKKGADMAIMDAIEKGATKAELIDFMGTKDFDEAVKRYATMFMEAF